MQIMLEKESQDKKYKYVSKFIISECLLQPGRDEIILLENRVGTFKDKFGIGT